MQSRIEKLRAFITLWNVAVIDVISKLGDGFIIYRIFAD